ncbi:MAG: dihydropteroate synthase [Alphaproteobacteria bacterium]|nr:dihydropteroate synthase [Alphaproteobacteria bacterium]MDE2631114.1 dihydropteroate synthase [Alphaproteobacteria bacterium]
MTAIILGIVNITEDSFSDGGRYLATEAALAHARNLARDGASVLDLGAAASNPDAKPVAPDEEVARLAPVVAALKKDGLAVSIDSFAPEVQRWALAQRVDYLNDIQGFADPGIYPALAASEAKLIVMHSVQGRGRATRVDVAEGEILDRVLDFFGRRIAALEQAGIARHRLVLDPGMGFFLGSRPEASFTMLRCLPDLKQALGLPVLVSVSRKSFLRRIAGRAAADAGPATLAAELFAVFRGADYIRTHDPAALADGLAVWNCATLGRSS